MLARGMLCRLAADASKSSTHDFPQFPRLLQRAFVARNTWSIQLAYHNPAAAVVKVALGHWRRGYATVTVEKPAAKRTVKKRTTKASTTKGATGKKAKPVAKKAKNVKKTRKVKKTTKAKKPATKKAELTPEQAERKQARNMSKKISELKKKALSPPQKTARSSAWTEYALRNQKKGEYKPIKPGTSDEFKNLTAAEREVCPFD